MDDQAVRNGLIRKMPRKRVVGAHKKQVETIVRTSLPSHERGRGADLLEGMVTEPGAPVERYGGGHRGTVRLTSVEAAVDYLKTNGGDVPFGFE